jgi:ubiquinone/menaquinone biosynthesis C-methylase UbiE
MGSEIKEHVKKRYGEYAEKRGCGCADNNGSATDQAKSIGYSAEELSKIPQDANLGLGCGNPIAYADLKPGETVLDLGSGAGIDAFLASNKVGESGKVIGVDMTEKMIKKARKNAIDNGYKNVEFRLGDIEDMPVEDDSIDVVISNCVINLTENKLKTFREAYRVLRKGGRILVSDLVTDGKLPEEVMRSYDAWADCIAGALPKSEYISTIKAAGFRDVSIVAESRYSEPDMDGNIYGKIISVKVRAVK